uniref:Uncharacterized protein n=1 Tax=Oryza barthii TaxID=65489 RepID=A0A0D3FD58_9ORYZ
MLGSMVDLEGQLDREGHVAKASTKKVDGDHWTSATDGERALKKSRLVVAAGGNNPPSLPLLSPPLLPQLVAWFHIEFTDKDLHQQRSGELLYIQLQASNFMRVEFVDEDYINGHGGQLRYMQMQI